MSQLSSFRRFAFDKSLFPLLLVDKIVLAKDDEVDSSVLASFRFIVFVCLSFYDHPATKQCEVIFLTFDDE